MGSAAIAIGIKTKLPELINEHQTGFVSGRYIRDNLKLIRDMIAYLKEKNLAGLLLNIDFDKAFDSIYGKFTFKVLKAFGFKKDICRWIETFYTHIKSIVILIVNGQPSKWFRI